MSFCRRCLLGAAAGQLGALMMTLLIEGFQAAVRAESRASAETLGTMLQSRSGELRADGMRSELYKVVGVGDLGVVLRVHGLQLSRRVLVRGML